MNSAASGFLGLPGRGITPCHNAREHVVQRSRGIMFEAVVFFVGVIVGLGIAELAGLPDHSRLIGERNEAEAQVRRLRELLKLERGDE